MVKAFDVQDNTARVRAQALAARRCDWLAAGLLQGVDDAGGCRQGAAVHRGDRNPARQAPEAVLQQRPLATALRPHLWVLVAC